MALVINATDEEISIQITGKWFTFTPAQRKTIRNASIARVIESDRRGCGLAVVQDLLTQEEDDGDVQINEEDLKQRKDERESQIKSACKSALDAYIARKRETIKNAQVSLARDLQRADYKYGAEHEYSDGEVDAMRLVAKYDKRGKDDIEKRLNEIKSLEKQIGGK